MDSLADSRSGSSRRCSPSTSSVIIWVKLAGGLYLLYLVYSHFWGHKEGADRRSAPKAKPLLGLSAFWATVLRVELVNLAFSIDSILVAVAMSPKQWVVITGGLLGIVALRMVVGQLIVLVERYPLLVDGAFIIIAWIGAKLCARLAACRGLRGVRDSALVVVDRGRRDLCDCPRYTPACRVRWTRAKSIPSERRRKSS